MPPPILWWWCALVPVEGIPDIIAWAVFVQRFPFSVSADGPLPFDGSKFWRINLLLSEAAWEAVKIAPGMASLAFLVRERWVRARPTAYFDAEPYGPGSSQMRHVLRVTNNAASTIVLEWSNRKADGLLRAKVDTETRSIISMIVEPISRCAVRAGETVNLPLTEAPNFGNMGAKDKSTFSFKWWPINPTLYPWPRTVCRKISKQDIEQITGR